MNVIQVPHGNQVTKIQQFCPTTTEAIHYFHLHNSNLSPSRYLSTSCLCNPQHSEMLHTCGHMCRNTLSILIIFWVILVFLRSPKMSVQQINRIQIKSAHSSISRSNLLTRGHTETVEHFLMQLQRALSFSLLYLCKMVEPVQEETWSLSNISDYGPGEKGFSWQPLKNWIACFR